jgi:hypothetical protein
VANTAVHGTINAFVAAGGTTCSDAFLEIDPRVILIIFRPTGGSKKFLRKSH